MAYDLDSPTVFRVGQPTLGVPTLSLDYRPGVPYGPGEVPLISPEALWRRDLETRLAALAVRVYDLEHRPAWYRRLLHWLLDRWPF